VCVSLSVIRYNNSTTPTMNR